MTASTGVFVSCEDYGDDIAHLQEQIDQNAATADSELAAKVAALQSQLSTLEAAQESLKEQLATAKAEAATAANNALAAAQAAQAAADKAQGGADEAKTAAAAAQAAADKANQALSDAVARVAVLESKVASLEATIAELSAASKDLNAKLAEVQALVNTLNASTEKNATDIAKLGEQVAALNTELGKVSTGLSARIDAIDKELNTIKSTYATKSELDAKAEVLANMDAQLQLQIQSNLNYIKEMQTAIAALGEKDKELAAAIEKNYADVMAEIEELATSQSEALATLEAAVKASDAKLDEAIKAVQAIAEANAAAIKDIQAALATKADKTAVDALAKDLAQTMADITEITADLAAYKADVAKEVEGIKASIEDLYDLAAQIAKTAQGNYADIAALRELTAEQILDIQDMLSQLSQQVTTNYLSIVDINVKLEEELPVIYDLIAQLTQQVTTNYKEVVKNQEDIYDLQVRIGNDEVRISDLEGIVSSLTSLAESNYKLIVANQEEIETLKGELASTMTEIADWQKEFEGKYETLVTETQAKIDAELAKLTALSENINVLNADVAALKEQMAAVLGRIQSIAFVPEYMNAMGNVIVPAYYYNWNNSLSNEVGDFEITPINVKFRVQPAEAAEALAQLYTSEKGKACFKLEYANDLKTRAASAAGYTVSNVQNAGNGMIVVTGVTAGRAEDIIDATYAYTLVVEDTSVTKKTSDYFNVETQVIDLKDVTIKHVNDEIQFTDFSLYNPARDITVNYVTAGGAEVVLKDLGRNPNLRIEAVMVDNEYVSLWYDTYKNNKGAIYDNNQKKSIKESLDNFWKNDDNAKYYVPVTSANNNVQVKGLETGKVVDKYGIGHSIKLMIVDTSFGRSNTADENTSGWNTNFGWVKVYEVEHVITKNTTATSEYNFNVEGTKLAWRNVDGKKDQTVYAADGLEWLKYGISSSPALQPGNAEGVIDIKTISYESGVSASVDQVTEELVAAIAAGNTTKLTFNNKTYGTVTFSVEKKTVKAVVSFNDNIPYGATYSFSKVYDTAFGKITLKGIVKLTINGETQDDMLKHTINWKDATTYNLGITNPYLTGEPYTAYVPDWAFNKGYENWAKYTNEENCTYEWYLLPEVVAGGKLTAVPNINSVNSTLSTVVLEDASTTVEGYLFNGGKIMFDRYISATYKKDKVDYTVKGSEALAQLQFITVVKDWNGNVVASEKAKFNYVDPIQAPELADITFTADQCKNLVNEPLVICQGINVTDVYSQAWYKEGELDPVVATVWGAKDVVYSIVNAEEVATVAGDLYIDSTDKDAVKIVFSNYQWASDLKVTVKASIEYNYGLVESEFVVTLPANPTLQ